MENELYKAIKNLNIENLKQDDKEELLKIFMHTKNSLVRDHIALIFSDLNYDKAVPYILKKVCEKELINNNSTLLFALSNLNVKKYFIAFIKIICTHEYAARLMAYEIVEEYVGKVSSSVKKSALKILNEHMLTQMVIETKNQYENSPRHFIEETINILK